MTDETDGNGKPDKPWRFQKGEPSRNPAGRPKGARNRLGEAFLEDLRAIWSEKGAEVLERAVLEKPMDFARMVAGLLPKELLVIGRPEESMTDGELADTIEALRAVARRHGSRPGEAGGGTAPPDRLQ